VIHLDESRREEALSALAESVGQILDLGPEWQVMAVVDGSVIGAVLVCGPEVHVGVTRPCFLRPLMREVIGDQIRRFGKSITKVRDSHGIGHRFVQRIGFKPVKTEGGLVHYELKELNYA
jgi:hypothetical protein